MGKVIYISGVTASGKTTTAEKLSNLLEIPFVKADDVYSMIARELDYDKPDDLVMPEEWKKINNIRDLKEKYYKQLLKDIKGDFIIEGFPLFFIQDRMALFDIIGEHKTIFFKINLPFNTWKKYSSSKFSKEPSKDSYNHLNKYFQAPSHYYEITNLDQLLVHHEKYQRNGFTDKKWELINLTSSEVKDKTVIDLGCNAGWIGRNCLLLGASGVVGVDNNWRYLEDAKDKGVFPVLADLDEFEFKKKFDITICLATFHYIKDKEKFIEKIANNTKEMFILEVPVSSSKEAVFDFHDTGKAQYYIPSMSKMKQLIEKYFIRYEYRFSIAPDNSNRFIFKCYK